MAKLKKEKVKVKKVKHSNRRLKKIDADSFAEYDFNSLPCVELLPANLSSTPKPPTNSGNLKDQYCEITLLALAGYMYRLKAGSSGFEQTHSLPLISFDDSDGGCSGLLFLLYRLSDSPPPDGQDNSDPTISDFCYLEKDDTVNEAVIKRQEEVALIDNSLLTKTVMGIKGRDNACAFPVESTRSGASSADKNLVVSWDWGKATQAMKPGLTGLLETEYFERDPNIPVVMVASVAPNRTVVWIPLPESATAIPAELTQIFTIYYPVYLDGPNIWIGKYIDEPWGSQGQE